MADESDLAGFLPPAPPPAPARREQAIATALRRFDGADEAVETAEKRRQPGRWASRPQIGILVAASLVLVIGLPLAMRTVDQWSGPRPADEPTGTAAIATQDRTAPPPAAEVALPAAADRAGAQPIAVATSAAEQEGVMKAQPAVPIGQVEAAFAPTAEPAPPAPPPPAPVVAAESAAAPPAPAPPPASSLGMAKAMRAASRAGAVREERAEAADVAGAGAPRLQRQRASTAADACTVDDPRRQLAGCGALIDPGAPGPDGRAAAKIADGLARAWEGDLAGAMAAFDAAIAIAPRSWLAHLNRALVWQRRGNLKRALADLDRAIALAPNAPQPLYHRSRVLARLGEASRAEADRQRADNADTED